MEISFVYPDLDTDLFVGSVDSFNGDISIDNLRTFLPRTVAFITLNVAVYIAWLLALWYILKELTYAVTAHKAEIIGLSLFWISLIFHIFFSGHYGTKKKASAKAFKGSSWTRCHRKLFNVSLC